jgi:hypothetical protein
MLTTEEKIELIDSGRATSNIITSLEKLEGGKNG